MAKVTRSPGSARENFEKGMRDLARLEAQAGWYSSSKYPNGTPVAYVATIQEFGAPEQGIDSRSFQRVTLDTNKEGYGDLMGKGARAVLQGKLTARAMLDAFGLQVAGDIRKTIAEGNFKAIAQATKAARARRRGVAVDAVNDDPLRDTNVMVNTLTNQTSERGKIK